MVDRYRIVSRLAVGGMAELYLADAQGIEGFEKRVVLKRIHPAHLGESEFVGMFLDEARITATLHHPNIAQVYDIGCDGEIYFFTMEHVDGRDVRHIYNKVHRRRQQVPLEHTISICMGALAGLHAAHEKRGPDGISLGIVHRDVSPSNVIVTWGGNVKLIDFGIAKAARRQTMTRNGAVKGKHCNMSPEQACGRPIDRRSDIFSLGIMLWEMSVGQTLFRAESEYEVMRKIVDGEVDRPSDRIADYPAELEAIVMRSLAQRVEDRYQTAEEMLIDLDAFARKKQLVTAPYALARYLARLFGDQETREANAPLSPPLFLLDGGSEIQLPDSEKLDAAGNERDDEDTGASDPVTTARPSAEPVSEPELELDHLTLPARRAREGRADSIAPPLPPPRSRRLAVAAGSSAVLVLAIIAALAASRAGDRAQAPVERPSRIEPAPAPAPEIAAEPEPEPPPEPEPEPELEIDDDDDIADDAEKRRRAERRARRRARREAREAEAKTTASRASEPAATPAAPAAKSDAARAAPPKRAAQPVPEWALDKPADQ